VADPKAPTCSMRVCTTIGAALPHRERQQAIQVLPDVSLRLLRSALPAPSDDTEDILQAAELALVELGTRLSGLVGEDGYRALVARAVRLAASEFPCLNAIKPAVSPPGRLVGLPGPNSRHATATEARNAAVAMLTELLWLLDEFFGRDLTQRVVELVWPCFGETGTSRDAESQLLTA